MLRIKTLFPLIVILAGLILRLTLLPSHYSFEWDQEDDAVKVMEMIHTHKPRLIGPWVASENGFFVAPWHYYFLVPFYLATGGDPIAGGYAAITVWLISTCLLFFLTRKMFGYSAGLLTLIFSGFQFSFTSWNAMYASIFSILIFFLCYRLIQKPSSRIFLSLCFFFGLAATTHLVPASLIVPLLASIFLSRYRPTPKTAVLGLVLFVSFTLPLVIFDLRHQFLNVHKIIEFATTGSSGSQSIFLRTFWRSLSLYGTRLINPERFFWLFIFLLSPFLLKNIRHRWLVAVWSLTPLVGLSIYHGNIPEYYYSLVTSLLPLFLSLAILKFKPLIFPPLIFGCLSIYSLVSSHPAVNLAAKKKIVQYFSADLSGQPFFVSLQFPMGQSVGYSYLMDYYRLKPTADGPLYTIHYSWENVSGKTVFSTPEGLSVTKR